MRILSISHSCVIPEYRKRMSHLARLNGVNVSLLVPGQWREYNSWVSLEKSGDEPYDIISVQPMSWWINNSGLRNVAHFYPRVKKIMEDVHPDIVELWEEPFSLVTSHTIFWAKRLNDSVKIIFFSAQNIRKNYPFPFCFFEKYTYRNADYAFLVSDDVASVLKAKGYDKQYLVLPLGVDPEFFCKKDVSSLKKDLLIRDFVVGFVGKIVDQKGILDLIQAISKINEKIQLLIIGSGNLRGEVEQRVRSLGLGQKTIITDAVPHSKIPEYLNCMDLLVVPSITLPHLKEQFGRIIIEGMACEVPVIGSDSGEIPKTIDKAGLIFRERDVKDLRDKIDILIKNPCLRGSLAKKGRKRVLENFSWKVIVEKQYQVYMELMRQRRCAT